jgi:hypothetical protein
MKRAERHVNACKTRRCCMGGLLRRNPAVGLYPILAFIRRSEVALRNSSLFILSLSLLLYTQAA